ALIALMSVILTPIMKLIALPVNAFSRHCERRADTFAVKKGYGESMISALKKLSKDNLTDLNPHPFIVKIEHSHPTLSQRIALVEEKMRELK
ncbi:MAG: M48 family metalloprotease, partial [Clostridia bacterium]|nr:M48 family metalloprotease [Clostridia bacterium]